jgi:hypothetical protein
MKTHPGTYAFALAILCFVLSGCRSPTGENCALNSDCPSGQICHPSFGICAELQCEEGACVSDIVEPRPDTPTKPDQPTTYSCDTGEKPGWRVTVFEALASTEGREGVDVDKDPSTCTPAPCDDGYDNGFVKVSDFNSVFADSIAKGEISMAFFQSKTDVQAFDVEGALGSGHARVLPSSFDADSLAPISSVPISSAKEGAISAEGGFINVTLLVANIPLILPVDHASIRGTLDETMELIVGGAIAEAALEAAVFAVPPGSLPDFIEDHEALMTVIRVLYEVDVDMDDTDGAESISINLRFEGTPTLLCFPASEG